MTEGITGASGWRLEFDIDIASDGKPFATIELVREQEDSGRIEAPEESDE